MSDRWGAGHNVDYKDRIDRMCATEDRRLESERFEEAVIDETPECNRPVIQQRYDGEIVEAHPAVIGPDGKAWLWNVTASHMNKRDGTHFSVTIGFEGGRAAAVKFLDRIETMVTGDSLQ